MSALYVQWLSAVLYLCVVYTEKGHITQLNDFKTVRKWTNFIAFSTTNLSIRRVQMTDISVSAFGTLIRCKKKVKMISHNIQEMLATNYFKIFRFPISYLKTKIVKYIKIIIIPFISQGSMKEEVKTVQRKLRN